VLPIGRLMPHAFHRWIVRWVACRRRLRPAPL